jgi:hypothetical protein
MNNTKNEIRAIGYYFVKQEVTDEWEVAMWDGEVWYCIGSYITFQDGTFDIVSDKINMPE